MHSGFYSEFQSVSTLLMVALLAASCGGSSGNADSTAGNTVPAASKDSYSIGAGLTLAVAKPGVLANDAAGGNNPVTAVLVSGPDRGTLELNPDGSFRYTPGALFSGSDKFTYRATTTAGESEAATVEIGFPNVILMIVDDMGQGDSRVYNGGSAIAMPNLEALASAGMRLDHAHSSSALCSPTRYSVMTGNYPYRGRTSSGVWNSYEPQTMILPGQETIADVFRQTGYRTGFVGKLHNGGAFRAIDGFYYTKDHGQIDFTRPFERGPTQFGFDYSFVLPAGLSGPPYAFFENDRLVRYDSGTGSYQPFVSNTEAQRSFRVYPDPDLYPGGGLIGSGGAVIDNYDSRAVGPEITAKAVQFIRDASEQNPVRGRTPFFLYFAPPQAHSPWTPPDHFNVADPVNTKSAAGAIRINGQTAVSARTDTLLELDAMLGALVTALADAGALDNTLIIFTSDNGSSPRDAAPDYDGIGERRDIGKRSATVHRNPQGIENGIPLRGYKQQIYEGGHRVPFVARWGNGESGSTVIPPGRQSTALVGLQDFAATFYSLLGTEHPSDQANDSFSFLPVLTGNPSQAVRRQTLIVQGSPGSAGGANAIDRGYFEYDESDQLWKLLVNSAEADPARDIVWKGLYNLSADPGETRNLLFDTNSQGRLSTMQTNYRETIAASRSIK